MSEGDNRGRVITKDLRLGRQRVEIDSRDSEDVTRLCLGRAKEEWILARDLEFRVGWSNGIEGEREADGSGEGGGGGGEAERDEETHGSGGKRELWVIEKGEVEERREKLKSEERKKQ